MNADRFAPIVPSCPDPRRPTTHVGPLLATAPTPLQALTALLEQCELSLDYRPSFRSAMSDAHCAIVNAKPASLIGSVMLGYDSESGDRPKPTSTSPFHAAAHALVLESEREAGIVLTFKDVTGRDAL